MTKKIQLVVALEGTGNNATNDAPEGMETNVAKAYSMLKADAEFDFSRNGSTAIDTYKKGSIGNQEALGDFLQKQSSSDNDTLSLKICQDGVGSQAENSALKSVEGGTGLGTDSRVESIIIAVRQIRKKFPDAEIELDGLGFSRGATALKDLFNRLSEEYPNDPNIRLNCAVLFDPVAAYGYPTDETHTGKDLGDPDIADANSKILELIAANEYRKAFASNPYQDPSVLHELFPGAHAQVGGGYANDILAAGAFGRELDFYSEHGKLALDYEKLKTEDMARMRMYNAVIGNPYLLRALITDSRVQSEDMAKPAEITDDENNTEKNVGFPVEEVQNNGDFDNATGTRDVEVERKSLSELYPVKLAGDIGEGIKKLFDSDYFDKAEAYQQYLSETFTGGDVNPSTIAQKQYPEIYFIKKTINLPPELEKIVQTFEEKVSAIQYSPEDMNTEAGILSAVDQLQIIVQETHAEIENAQVSDETVQEDVAKAFETLDKRLDYYETRTQEEFEEIRTMTDEAIVQAITEAQIGELECYTELSQAYSEGDVLSITEASLDYILSLDKLADSLDPLNSLRIHEHKDDLATAGFLDESTEKLIGSISTGLSLYNELDDGDTISALQTTADFVLEIDGYLEAKAAGENNAAVDDNAVGLSNHQQYCAEVFSSVMGAVHAFDSGDTLDKSIATVDVITSLNGRNGVLGPVSSALNTYQSYESFQDAWDSGDGLAIGSSGARLTSNVVQTYNDCASALSVKAIPASALSYVGYTAAVLQLASGDTTGALVSAASTYLMTVVPYGWAAAAALQVGAMLLTDDSPAEATASFSIDENGHVVMSVDGDSSMQAKASGVGGKMLTIMQKYKDNGGRLMIEGALPSFKVIDGSESQITYGQEGGKITILVGDVSKAAVRMYGALVARDNGERLDSAVTTAKLPDGGIDWARVDSIMSGYGFTKRGDNYVLGETKELEGAAAGTGVFNGGGQMGSEGQLFTASSSDIKSLPSKTSPLPSRQMGEIIKIISAKNFFAGTGCELAAMSLILGAGLTGTVETSLAAAIESPDSDDAPLPLDGVSLETYLASLQTGAYPEDGVVAVSGQVSFPGFEDDEALYRFFVENWSSLLMDNGAGWSEAEKAEYIRQHGEPVGYNGLLPDGTRVPWWSDNDNITEYFKAELGRAVATAPAKQLAVDQVDLQPYSAQIISGIEVGAFFTMSEDTVLRFLSVNLIDGPATTGYQAESTQFEVVSFADVKNGTVWIDQNGDVRFDPAENFSGTASFIYTLKDSQGNLIQKQALIDVQDVNDDPTVNDDFFTLNEGDVFYLDSLLANDSDLDGDTLAIDHLRGLENGSIAMVDNRLAFIPDDGFYGEISFSYWVRDHSDTYPVMGKATLNFQDVNTGGAAGDDRFLVFEDSTIIISPAKLLENDIDYDGERLEFQWLGEAVNGSAVMQSDGTILFTPEAEYAGTNCGFYYFIQDESSNITKGWVNVDVLDQRDAPVITSVTMAPISEDEVFVFSPDQVGRFILDADGDAVHLCSMTNIEGGQLTVQDGYLAFSPDKNYTGTASFDYCAADSHKGTFSGHLSFEILPVNDAIETGPDLLAGQEDCSVSTTIAELLANDRDVDGTVITFVGVGASQNGTVTVDDADTVTFIPEHNYAGIEAGFEYYVMDSEGQVSVGLVRVSVAAVNDVPEIISNELTGPENSAVVFDAATLAQLFTDIDGDDLSVTQMSVIAGGAVEEKNGVFIFSPEPDYKGIAELTVTVDDGNGGVLTKPIAINLMKQDAPAIIGPDSFITAEEQSVAITVDELLQNDSDPDGPLSYNGIGQVFNGSVTVSAAGEIVFTPDENYFGADGGFEYKVVDAEGFEAVGRVTIEVTGVNDAPVIIATQLQTIEDQPIVFNESTIAQFIRDVDGDLISLTAITNVHGGTVTENGGVYTFTPDADYNGSGRLEYSAADSNGETVTGMLDIAILAQNDETAFGDDTFTTVEEHPVTISAAELLANDIDRDGELIFSGLGEARNGTAALNEEGIISFTPDKDYAGRDAGFYYLVDDAQGYEAVGWVTVDVSNVNDAPVITGSRLRMPEDETIAFTPEEIAKFLFDADGDLYSLDLVANVSGGRMELKNGVYTYIPDADFYGEGSLEYTAVSDSGDSIDGVMALLIDPVNDLPAAAAVSATGFEDNEIIFQIDRLMVGMSDPEDGADVHFAGINSSLHGDVYVNHDDNTLHFIPDDDYSGDAGFSFDVMDTEGGITQGYAAIRLTAVNDAPLARDDERISAWSSNGYENIYSAAAFLANDLDPDGDSLSIASVSGAQFGTVTLDGGGNVHYIAASDDWVGIDSFTYTVIDSQGETSTATASLDVMMNTSPDIYPEILYTREDIISIISQDDLLANDSDVDGDGLQIIAVDGAEHCSAELLADGTIQFAPELNYNNLYPGQAGFRYTVTDGISDPVAAVAYFDIDPVNDAPILVAERITGAVEDNIFSFQVEDILANDTDVEMASAYEEDALYFVGVLDAAHGSIYTDDTGTVFYKPEQNFYGTETFRYSVMDASGAESVVESEILVAPVNDNPEVQEDIATGAAEDCIWNKYSIRNYLTANDFDADGDSLSISNAKVVSGNAEVKIADGYLQVKPAFKEDSVVVNYTVTDDKGGSAVSKLTIPDIRQHNFAPEITNSYATTYVDHGKIVFSFLVQDKNGGDNWTDYGKDMDDIASITAGHLSCSDLRASLVVRNAYGHFLFEVSPFVMAVPTFYANLTITAVDKAGASSTKYVSIKQLAWSVGIHNYPVVLDLDGDGVELLSASQGVAFDWNGTDDPERCGWVAPDDGFLVYDHDGDRQVTMADEISLKDYDPDATTDLEGLRAFDSNGNGVFEQGDERWAEFGVWQDSNSNGITEEGEFKTLEQHGITVIHLESDGIAAEVEGNTVYGVTTYELEDGSTQQAFDVGLTGEMVEAVMVEIPAYEADEGVIQADEAELQQTETQGDVLADNAEADAESPADNQELTDAELDRLVVQMQSDIAGAPELDSSIDSVSYPVEDLALCHVAADEVYSDVFG